MQALPLTPICSDSLANPGKEQVSSDNHDRRDPLTAFFGDSPARVIVRLVVMSLLVGFLLTILGLSPLDLFNSLDVVIREAWANSAGIVRSIIGYVITGAAIVIPIWLIMRLASAGRRR